MSTLSQLTTQRAAAGAAYASAVDALKTAYINLAALDRTMENRNVTAPVPQSSSVRSPMAGRPPCCLFCVTRARLMILCGFCNTPSSRPT